MKIFYPFVLVIFIGCTSPTPNSDASFDSTVYKEAIKYKPVGQVDSLKKYSYFLSGAVKFRQPSGIASGALIEGSGFFINRNNKVYLITAEHVLSSLELKAYGVITPDSDSTIAVFTNDEMQRYADIILRINVKKIRATSRDPRLQFVDFPDVYAYEVPDYKKYKIDTMGSYPLGLPKKPGEIIIYGFPSKNNESNNKGLLAIHEASLIKTKIYDIKQNYYFPPSYKKTGVDSFNIVISPKDLKLDASFRGYSGSPAFVKDLNTGKWFFLGVFTGVDIINNSLFCVKTSFINYK